jgi:hypothetical protein
MLPAKVVESAAAAESSPTLAIPSASTGTVAVKKDLNKIVPPGKVRLVLKTGSIP